MFRQTTRCCVWRDEREESTARSLWTMDYGLWGSGERATEAAARERERREAEETRGMAYDAT